MGSPSRQAAEIMPTHTPTLFEAACARAAALLRAGEVVAVPTETVYGLAANALDARAVARVFEIKGRPAHNPVIVHVAGLEMARECAAAWNPLADRLGQAFWPGPLALVLPKAARLPANVTAGGSTVGIRWPSHPFIQALIKRCGFPLAAPSANPAGRLSPTNAEHVRLGLGDRVPLIVEGGQCAVGIESTVVDVTADPPRLLRPGMIHEPALVAVTGELRVGSGEAAGVLRSPGLLTKHYAPRARLECWSWGDEGALRQQALGCGVPMAKVHVISHTRIPSGDGFGRVSVIPHDPEAFARALYAELHQCDEDGAEVIVVEAPPQTPEWSAIADRLRRAAARE